MRSGNLVFESPVSRGANSRFAIVGKNEHVDMSTHDDLARLAATAKVGRICFDPASTRLRQRQRSSCCYLQRYI
eukprot:4245746-Pleurochrysis_carterae.AAC.1